MQKTATRKEFEITVDENSFSHENQPGKDAGYYSTWPVSFPDGYHGYFVLMKGVKRPQWKPSADIEKIVIHFR